MKGDEMVSSQLDVLSTRRLTSSRFLSKDQVGTNFEGLTRFVCTIEEALVKWRTGKAYFHCSYWHISPLEPLKFRNKLHA